jgi:hypothetical protein
MMWESVKQMFWAGFGDAFCTGLVPLDGDPKSIRGGVMARVIYDLMKPGFPNCFNLVIFFCMMEQVFAVHRL